MGFDEAAWIGAEITEFVDFDTILEPIDAFNMGIGVGVALQMPEAEQLIIKAEKRGKLGVRSGRQ